MFFQKQRYLFLSLMFYCISLCPVLTPRQYTSPQQLLVQDIKTRHREILRLCTYLKYSRFEQSSTTSLQDIEAISSDAKNKRQDIRFIEKNYHSDNMERLQKISIDQSKILKKLTADATLTLYLTPRRAKTHNDDKK